MEDVIDLIATDASPSEISDKIKDVLFNKAAGNIEDMRPAVAISMFDVNAEVESESEE